MDNCNKYKIKLGELESNLAALEIKLERATVDQGDYMNKIDHYEEKIEFYKNRYEKCMKSKTPDQCTIYFYIISMNKNKIKENLGDRLFSLFREDCYSDIDISCWKPFAHEGNITSMLQEAMDKYRFEPIYLNGMIEDKNWIQIDENITSSIAVIDLFSLYEDNAKIAGKFDSSKAGVLLPICSKLHTDLIEFAENKHSDVFKLHNAKTRQFVSCDFYASNITNLRTFKENLIRILQNKFPIKNKSSYKTDARGLNTSLL